MGVGAGLLSTHLAETTQPTTSCSYYTLVTNQKLHDQGGSLWSFATSCRCGTFVNNAHFMYWLHLCEPTPLHAWTDHTFVHITHFMYRLHLGETHTLHVSKTPWWSPTTSCLLFTFMVQRHFMCLTHLCESISLHAPWSLLWSVNTSCSLSTLVI
jgi:hypothetical protein